MSHWLEVGFLDMKNVKMRVNGLFVVYIVGLVQHCQSTEQDLKSQSFSSLGHKMAKSALVLIADGSEEMEFVITVDVLRRANINVVAASVNSPGPHIACSRGINIVPDLTLDEAVKKGPYDIIILPGGLKGAETFAKDAHVGKLLQQFEKEGKKVAAICAAPTALKQHGVFKETKLTSYPSFKDEMSAGGYPYSDDNVVVSGNLITSKGPSTAFEFALQIVEELEGAEAASNVAKGLLLPR
uniref:Protein deglycase DJ-1zDJ-1 n=1 Tax=Cacopsylla melanoneura TaxID=428564 RepID=A0A8D8XLH9_9HEMI